MIGYGFSIRFNQQLVFTDSGDEEDVALGAEAENTAATYRGHGRSFLNFLNFCANY